MTPNTTTTLQYWLNWRFLLCATLVSSCSILAFFLIWKYEGARAEARAGAGDEEYYSMPGMVYEDESWRPCLKQIHPAWLLAFRVLSFFVMAALLVSNVVLDGGGIFYYYTQWTFLLVTIYFALGSLLSINGCHQYVHRRGGNKVFTDLISSDSEQSAYMALSAEENEDTCTAKNTGFYEMNGVSNGRQIAGFWGYTFQIMYQTNAGAVMITDCVFWVIMYPFLTAKDQDLNFMIVMLHSINAVLLLGDTALNSLHFLWFRISYFLLWTAIYVIFQWVIHASLSIGWPYPFLDLSPPLAPVWYLVVALLHIPCYTIYLLVVKLKHFLLARWIPQYSYSTS